MSKLLKQNGVDGKILRSNDGSKVLKQNYNFGKSWKSYNSDGAYVEITKAILPGAPFTIAMYGKSIGSPNGFHINSNLASGNLTFQTTPSFTSGVARPYYGGGLSNSVHSILQLLSFDGLQAKDFIKNQTFVNIGTALVTNIDYVRLQMLGDGSNYILLNDFLIYDRALLIEEAKYKYNNGLGNDPLSLASLWTRLKLDKAEILNTGGADFVGVRDVSGNGNHQPILSMPAGTLEEQRDRANLLYFEQW